MPVFVQPEKTWEQTLRDHNFDGSFGVMTKDGKIRTGTFNGVENIDGVLYIHLHQSSGYGDERATCNHRIPFTEVSSLWDGDTRIRR